MPRRIGTGHVPRRGLSIAPGDDPARGIRSASTACRWPARFPSRERAGFFFVMWWTGLQPGIEEPDAGVAQHQPVLRPIRAALRAAAVRRNRRGAFRAGVRRGDGRTSRRGRRHHRQSGAAHLRQHHRRARTRRPAAEPNVDRVLQPDRHQLHAERCATSSPITRRSSPRIPTRSGSIRRCSPGSRPSSTRSTAASRASTPRRRCWSGATTSTSCWPAPDSTTPGGPGWPNSTSGCPPCRRNFSRTCCRPPRTRSCCWIPPRNSTASARTRSRPPRTPPPRGGTTASTRSP